MSSILIKGMEMPKDKPICIIIDPAGQARCYDLNNDKYADDELFEAIAAAEARRVVLCKDCYAYRRDKELAEAAYLDPEMYCGLLRCEMGEDSFCSYGKRKEET